jgi:hypothetical protein
MNAFTREGMPLTLVVIMVILAYLMFLSVLLL